MIKQKGYIAREGYFGTNWEFDYVDGKIFKTKGDLHKYMKDINGFGCTRSRKNCYDTTEQIYENQLEGYGYEVVEVEIK